MLDALQLLPMNARIIGVRRVWLKVHCWAALSMGWLLAMVALAGALLLIAQPLDRLAHPQLFKSEQVVATSLASAKSMESIHRELTVAFGSQANLTLRPPRAQDESMWVIVRSPSWNGTVYLHPKTGLEQGRRGEYEGVVNLLFKFHSALLLEDTGKAVLAWIALCYLALLVSGLVLWWPKRWPPTLNVELRKDWLRGLFDLHRTGGVILGLLIAVSVATGAYMAWRPLSTFVTTLSGETPVTPPSVTAAEMKQPAAIPLDALLASAQARFPEDSVGYIQITADPGRPVRIRMRLEGDPHPNGLTSIWLHPQTGTVLAVNRWDELDLGGRAFSYVYPLHTGELGGLFLEIVTFIVGLGLAMLGISGICLWWLRRSRSRIRKPSFK